MTEQKALELFNRMQQWQAKRHSISGYLDSGGSMRTEAGENLIHIKQYQVYPDIPMQRLRELRQFYDQTCVSEEKRDIV
jgi:hypothetical protein